MFKIQFWVMTLSFYPWVQHADHSGNEEIFFVNLNIIAGLRAKDAVNGAWDFCGKLRKNSTQRQLNTKKTKTACNLLHWMNWEGRMIVIIYDRWSPKRTENVKEIQLNIVPHSTVTTKPRFSAFSNKLVISIYLFKL